MPSCGQASIARAARATTSGILDLAVEIRCLRCGGAHFVWECEVPAAHSERGPREPEKPGKFDKVAYQREYMRKRREAQKDQVRTTREPAQG